MTRQAKVLDSWAVMAFLEDEAAAQEVEQILVSAMESGTRLLMTTVNLGEVWYSVARVCSPQEADAAVRRVASLGIEVFPADWKMANQAARFKARGKIAYADCFAAALAYLEQAELLTGDQEFRQFESEIRIAWL